MTQDQIGTSAGRAAERSISHTQGLLIACGVALVLHAINFIAVPLAVLKDSLSYLQGVAYWLQYHSLDGASSYRGLATTLLFTPAIVLFGRNAWGLKLVLHVFALACVPLSYRLGWQLGRRRWFAFSAALCTAVISDLYTYSSYVLAEGVHVFSGLLFLTFLISRVG